MNHPRCLQASIERRESNALFAKKSVIGEKKEKKFYSYFDAWLDNTLSNRRFTRATTCLHRMPFFRTEFVNVSRVKFVAFYMFTPHSATAEKRGFDV